jgi:hypothetical protein
VNDSISKLISFLIPVIRSGDNFYSNKVKSSLLIIGGPERVSEVLEKILKYKITKTEKTIRVIIAKKYLSIY